MAEQHDLFCKHLLFEALEPISRAEMEKAIAVLDAQYVDLYCEPLPERPSPDQLPHLGILFRMTERRCLFEPFSESPAVDDIDHNLRKQLALHHLLRRGCKPERPPKPILWILSPGRPEEVIRSFALQPAADWPTGFYAAAPGLQLFVVVIAELPKTPETRLLRLLGSRWERFRAVREVLNLPIGDVRRQPVVALLLAFRYFFAAALDVDLQKEEQDIMTQLRQEFELLKANLRSEGRLEGKAEALLAVLSARGLVISDSVRAQIVSCQDLEMLDRWLIRAVSASTASDIVAAA